VVVPGPAALVDAVRAFVEAEVRPVADALEHADRYPEALVARLRDLGLFGALVPAAWGGLGLDVATYARVIEELCRGWMSLAGVINSHTMAALIVLHHGTEAQRQRFLPRFARGEARGGLCLTEPHAGSDVQAIRTRAHRQGDAYVLTGTKMFVTNGREGNTFAVLAVTDPDAVPRHRGLSCFIVEKGHPGLRVGRSLHKLGYRGVDTAELVFDGCVVPAANLVGGVEGRGFAQVMSALEVGRINIAARAVGVAQAALETARDHARARGQAPPELADMAARVAAARRLTAWAAAAKDRGARCDLEAGMAKLWASEAAHAVATTALALGGLPAQRAPRPLERHYRDTPLMIIGEGTNEIQRLVIARQLFEGSGERAAALFDEAAWAAAEAPGAEERRQMARTVRQLVDKEVTPVVAEHEQAGRWPAALLARLRELGVLGALAPAEAGGLDLDLATVAWLLEELARGWASLAVLTAGHLLAGWVLARLPAFAARRGALAQGAEFGAAALESGVDARRERDGWRLHGTLALVPGARRAGVLIVAARPPTGEALVAVVPRDAPGVRVGAPEPTLGLRGAEAAEVALTAVRVEDAAVLTGAEAERADALARVAVGAAAVGVARAAIEAALRYARQREAFGRPIAEHQAVQLLVADMATATAAARLLVAEAAARPSAVSAGQAKLVATEAAQRVTLDAMRIHGGYGYVTEFPVERFYRDASWLAAALGGHAAERARLARELAAA